MISNQAESVSGKRCSNRKKSTLVDKHEMTREGGGVRGGAASRGALTPAQTDGQTERNGRRYIWREKERKKHRV